MNYIKPSMEFILLDIEEDVICASIPGGLEEEEDYEDDETFGG